MIKINSDLQAFDSSQLKETTCQFPLEFQVSGLQDLAPRASALQKLGSTPLIGALRVFNTPHLSSLKYSGFQTS